MVIFNGSAGFGTTVIVVLALILSSSFAIVITVVPSLMADKIPFLIVATLSSLLVQKGLLIALSCGVEIVFRVVVLPT